MRASSKHSLAVLGRSLLQRKSYAAAPETAAEPLREASVALSPTAPVLLQLKERTWGPVATLPVSAIPVDAASAPRIGVVRDAYAMYNQTPKVLSQAVASIGTGKAAVLAEVAENPHRLVVDEYVHDEDLDQFLLQGVSTDLFRLLKREGIRTALVPDLAAVPKYNSCQAVQRGLRQNTNEILMVAPTAFGFNSEAAEDNYFMHDTLNGGKGTAPGTEVTNRVLQEFSGLYRELTEVAGVKVELFCHNLFHGTPDAVFPNNWFSTHPAAEAQGSLQRSTLVLYPMKHASRRHERRDQIIAVLRNRGYSHLFDMSYAERAQHFLEGTGAMVPDRVNGVVYCSLSERAEEMLARQWASELGYKDVVTFRSRDARGKCVYHTNVMMSVGTDVAVICLASLASDAQRRAVLAKLEEHHEVVDITLEQMDAMCGNVIELEDGRGLPVLAMSTQAYNAFTPDQKKILLKHVAALHHAPIDTLERVGGGSVRCTIGELF